MSTYSYDEKFFQYTNQISRRSAEVVVPIVYEALRPSSVLDLGCGCGVWLAQWRRIGAEDVLGVDGEYVARENLAIPADRFMAHDLGTPLDLGRRFDLAQSLEVAEHLQAPRARGFVGDLCRHSDIVVFGAAPPGQGGENHVNERSYDYWRDLFAAEGYDAYDFIRPQVLNRQEVASWHRYNPIVYVERSRASDLPDSVRAALIPPGASIRDLSPILYKARKAVIRHLPPWATRALANARKRTVR